jgi:hypothetical protein
MAKDISRQQIKNFASNLFQKSKSRFFGKAPAKDVPQVIELTDNLPIQEI